MCCSKLLAVLCGVAVSAGLFVGDTPRMAIVNAAPQIGKAEQPRVDLWGDPLPPGALARFGTLRYRSEEPIGRGHIGILADSKTVVIGVPGSHRLQLMDAGTGKVVREISTGDIAIQKINVLPKGECVAVIGKLPERADGTIPAAVGILNVVSGKLVRTCDIPGNDINFGVECVTPDSKAVASLSMRTGILRIREIATGVELCQHQFPHGNQEGLAFSADGRMIAFATGTNTEKMYFWKWQDGGEPLVTKVPEGVGYHLTFAPDGKTLAESPDLVAIVRVWDVASGKLKYTLVPPEEDLNRTNSVVFTPDGKTIVAAFRGNKSSSVHFWDAATAKHKHRLDGPVGSVLIAPNSKLLVATRGGGLRAWEWGAWKELSAIAEGHRTIIDRVAIKDKVVVSSGDNTIRIWDAATSKQRFTLAHGLSVVGVGPDIALSPDGNKLASVSLDDTVCLWDVTTGNRIYKLAGHGRYGMRGAVGFTPDGKHFLSHGWDNYLRKWEVATGKAVAELKIQPKGIRLPDKDADQRREIIKLLGTMGESHFAGDGMLVVMATANEFHIFNVATGKDLFQLVYEGALIQSHAVSPDGRLVLASIPSKYIIKVLPDGTVRSFPDKDTLCLWELATRQVRKTISFPDGGAGTVAFSPDGKRFAVAVNGPVSRVHIYDMAGGKEIAVIEGYRGTVHSLAFGDDGQRLATGMSDTTVLLWDVAAFKK
jgi:WD40 repeat protein